MCATRPENARQNSPQHPPYGWKPGQNLSFLDSLSLYSVDLCRSLSRAHLRLSLHSPAPRNPCCSDLFGGCSVSPGDRLHCYTIYIYTHTYFVYVLLEVSCVDVCVCVSPSLSLFFLNTRRSKIAVQVPDFGADHLHICRCTCLFEI